MARRLSGTSSRYVNRFHRAQGETNESAVHNAIVRRCHATARFAPAKRREQPGSRTNHLRLEGEEPEEDQLSSLALQRYRQNATGGLIDQTIDSLFLKLQ